MKHFSDYILERRSLKNVQILEDANGNIIAEGFWKKLGGLFGFDAGKIQKLGDKMEKWSDDFKNAFTVSQYTAAQSKNKDIAKLMAEYVDAIDKGGDAPLKFLKERAQEIKEKPELLKDNNVAQVYLGFMKNLAELSKNVKDEEGNGLAKEGADVIGKQNSDIKNEYEQTSKKVEKVDDGPTDKDAEGGKEEEKNSEEKKEVTEDDIKTSISDNKDILSPLVNIFGGKINGEELAKKVEELMSKDPVYKTNSEAARTANTLGIASIICGAMMFKSHKCFERATEYIIDNEKKLRKAVPTKDLKLKTGDKK